MHTKIVIVVTQTFWSCSACKLCSKQSESIDDHLKVKHSGFHGVNQCEQLSEVDQSENGSFSDSELDIKAGYKWIGFDNIVRLKGNERNSSCVLQKTMSTTELKSRGIFSSGRKRKSSRKQPEIIKQQLITACDIPCKNEIFEDNADSGDAFGADTFDADKDKDEEWTVGKQKNRTSKPRLAKKPFQASKRTGSSKISLNKTLVTLSGSSHKNKTPSLSQKETKSETHLLQDRKPGISTASDVKVRIECPRRGRKCKKNVDEKEIVLPTHKEQFEKPVKTPKRLQGKAETNNENKQSILKKEMSTSAGANRSVQKSALSYQKPLDRAVMKTTVDKSKIATCCAPWLFDTGRKAGDKVNKKPRRALLPEEKAAVRKLYGVPAPDFVPANKYDAVHMHADTLAGRSYGQQKKSVEYAVNVDLKDQYPQSHRDNNTVKSDRHFLMNAFTVMQEFLPDSSGTQKEIHSGYSELCQQQNGPKFAAAQSTEFYQSPANITQTKTFRDYSGFNPDGQAPPVTSATNINQQFTGSSYSVHNVNVSGQSLLQSQASSLSSDTSKVSSDVQMLPTSSGMSINSKPVYVSPLSTTSSAQEKGISKSKDTFGPDENRAVSQKNQSGIGLKTFDSLGLMQKDMKKEGNLETIECKRCQQKFHGMHQLNLHVFSVHETEKQGFCFICNEDTEGLETLERHVYRHAFHSECILADLQFHDCRICQEELQSSYPVLRLHYYQHHIAHVCVKCFQNFSDTASYVEHCKRHEGQQVVCSICGAEFSSVESLQLHFPCAEDMWAEDDKGAQCPKCELWCPNRAVVEAHRKQHRSQEDVEAYRKGAKKGFPCISCDKVFKNKHACRRHVKMVHQGVSCYKHYCEYCGKGFLTKGHMRDHIALHHLGIKRYKCEYCDQQFVCGPTLRRHVRKEHTKHKPYACEYCGERFFEKTPLQRHLTFHTGLAPFMCEHCGKGFYTKHSFTYHRTTHSTVRDFSCSGCQKGFTRKYNLQAHMKICKLVSHG